MASRFVLGELLRHRFAVLWLGWAASCLISYRDISARLSQGRDVPYAIGDLLVNYHGGFTRRGLFGELAVWLSDGLGGAPLHWAWAMAAIASGLLTWLGIRVLRAFPNEVGYLPFILSPVCLLFVAYDSSAIFRKEMFGYLLLALVLNAALARSERAAAVWLAAALVFAAPVLLAHEAVIFMAPAYAMAGWLVARAWPQRRVWVLGWGVCLVIVALVVLAAIVTAPVPNVAEICAATRLRSCGGPFSALELTTWQGVEMVVRRRTELGLVYFGAFFALALAPLFGLRIGSAAPRLHLWVIGFAVLGVLPMFALGYDYGRWVQMTVLPLTLLAAVAVRLGVARLVSPWPPLAICLFVGTWSLSHAHAVFQFHAWMIWPALAVLSVSAWALGRFHTRK
ncbi:hypothetical protein [Candidatus Rhodobacter oscarellae]|uniref:hypothetical protein n=1 Tax=Candidatus Rhodobacter oscarellae TaxID=1675527 RepID=UPI001F39CF70|nr:hypothetical protein [Candidatus Rhodobacter lobularis]